MPHIIVSLEQTLRIWEDYCFIINLLGRTQMREKTKTDYNLYGPFLHFAEFRNYILKSYEDFNMEEFSQKFLEDRFTGQPLVLHDLVEIPFELALWSYSSRRIYHLKSDMCHLLNATSIKNVKWKNVRLPFDAFTLMLDEPIISPELNEEYDCILISSHNSYGLTILSIRLINTKVKAYNPIPDEEKKLMQRFFKEGNSLKLLARLKKYYNAIPDPLILPHFELPLSEEIQEANVTDSITDLVISYAQKQSQLGKKIHIPTEDCIMPEEGNIAARLVVGVCLFLTTKHAASIKNYTYRQTERKQGQIKSIIDESEIFKITLGQVLTPQEKTNCSTGLKREGGYTLDPHWRQGVYRFPPYTANDPEAEKTVWVRPSFVNYHRLEGGQLPYGSEMDI